MNQEPDVGLLRLGVHIGLLGTPQLLRPDGLAHPLERKDAALLALLAIDGPQQRSRLGALLWPDAAQNVARGNLRQRLFRLRSTMGRDVVQAAQVLRLADDVTLDIAELHRRLLADPQAGTGELLAGHDYADGGELAQWVHAARERWRSTRLALLAQVASDLEGKRQIAAALPYALRLLADEPLLEHAHRRMMRLHYLRGDRAAAMAAYDACREALGSALGLRPSAETVELARLVERSSVLPQQVQPTPQRPVAITRPPRLVGRDAEWQSLSRCAIALVVGEPGIGKTRLLGDFAAATAGDAAIVAGARPGDARLPYALLARVVRACVERFGAPGTAWVRAELARIAPELGDAAGGAFDALRMQQAAIDALTGRREGAGLALLALDDLHFADEATLEMLPALASALRGAGMRCVLGVRGNEMPPAVSAWLGAQDDAAPVGIALGPLDLPAVRALLESLAIPDFDAARWAAPLARHTGGNPLFILETLVALLDGEAQAPSLDAAPELPAPAGLAALIERRLGQLGEAALRLARLAALAGPDFSVALASAVLQRQPLDIADAWRELEAASIIRDDAFAHDLVFEATLRSVPRVIARALHGDIAAFLQSHSGAPARIASHWHDAERWPPAAAAYEQAARAALAASRRADEVALWQRAIDCHERAGQRSAAFAARCASVKAVMASRPLAEAHALTERLLVDARTDAERLDALLERTWLLLVEHDSAGAAEALAVEAGDLARRLGLRWREVDAARGLALSLAQRKRGSEAAALLGRFAEMVESEGDALQQHHYWADMAFVLPEAGRRREAADACRRAADSAEALGDLHEAVTCVANLSIMLVQSGRPQQAFEQAVRAQRMRERLGANDGVVAGAADMNVASFGLLLGRFDTALACYESALERFRKGNAAVWVASCEHNLASTWLQLGQTARARQALTQVDAGLPPTTRARRLIVESRVERALGRAALPGIREALQVLEAGGDPMHLVLARLDESRELEPVAAAEQCRRCRDSAEQIEIPAAAMRARLFEIEARQRAGDVDAAGALAREARSRLPECRPNDIYWGEALWLVARALDACGDDAAARAVLDEALRWIHDEALLHVPEPFRDTFLHRQSVNRELLALAARRRG